MKVCILSPSVQKHMVLVSAYKAYFEQNGIDYDFIYPDKYHQEEQSAAHYTYRYEVRNATDNFTVIRDYLSFIKYAKQILNREKYDLVIAWTEVAAAIFANYLSKEYKGKYVVVVLDLFDETRIVKNPYILTALLNKAIKHSLFSTVSSPGYIQYLTKSRDYLFVQNINRAILPSPKTIIRESGKPITILYSGHISYPQYARKMIDRFKNDKRFFMKIVGAASEPVAEYAHSVGCENIEVFGRFESKDTVDILNGGDIIYNVYGNDKHCVQTALSNKLYYAASMHLPIIVSPHTYMEDITKKLGIGYSIDFDDKGDICGGLYDWYMQFDQSGVVEKCDAFMEEAFSSHSHLYGILDDYFKSLSANIP